MYRTVFISVASLPVNTCNLFIHRWDWQWVRLLSSSCVGLAAQNCWNLITLRYNGSHLGFALEKRGGKKKKSQWLDEGTLTHAAFVLCVFAIGYIILNRQLFYESLGDPKAYETYSEMKAVIWLVGQYWSFSGICVFFLHGSQYPKSPISKCSSLALWGLWR